MLLVCDQRTQILWKQCVWFTVPFSFNGQRILINVQKISSLLHLPFRINDCWVANRDAPVVCHFKGNTRTFYVVNNLLTYINAILSVKKDESFFFLLSIEENENCNNWITLFIFINLKNAFSFCIFLNYTYLILF